MQAIHTNGIGQVLMSVHDVDRQADFYVEKLGLPLLFRVPGTAMAFFDAGSFRLYVDQWYEGAPVSRPVLYFKVPSVPKAHDALVAAGVSAAPAPEGEPHVVDRTAESELWMSFLHDPEATLFALMAEVPIGK
jgi:catechol 2,3-dioxygenase-like lactoylglutathione lyase family enzyme